MLNKTTRIALGAALLFACAEQGDPTAHQEDSVRTDIDQEKDESLCGGQEDTPEPIVMRWHREGRAETGSIALELISALETPVRLQLEVHAGSRRTLLYRDLELHAKGRTQLELSLPEDLRGASFSTQLKASVKATVRGQLMGRYSAEPLYMHHEDSEPYARVYDVKSLRERYRGGDLQRVAFTGIPTAEIGGASMAYEIADDSTTEDEP